MTGKLPIWQLYSRNLQTQSVYKINNSSNIWIFRLLLSTLTWYFEIQSTELRWFQHKNKVFFISSGPIWNKDPDYKNKFSKIKKCVYFTELCMSSFQGPFINGKIFLCLTKHISLIHERLDWVETCFQM